MNKTLQRKNFDPRNVLFATIACSWILIVGILFALEAAKSVVDSAGQAQEEKIVPDHSIVSLVKPDLTAYLIDAAGNKIPFLRSYENFPDHGFRIEQSAFTHDKKKLLFFAYSDSAIYRPDPTNLYKIKGGSDTIALDGKAALLVYDISADTLTQATQITYRQFYNATIHEISTDDILAAVSFIGCEECAPVGASVYNLKTNQIKTVNVLGYEDLELLKDGEYRYKKMTERPCSPEEKGEPDTTYYDYPCYVDSEEVPWTYKTL